MTHLLRFGVATLAGAALLGLAGPARAQSSGVFAHADQAGVAYTLAQTHPVRSCASLRALSAGDLTILSAETVAGHCRVRALIAPENRIEVDLPDAWNRRLYMFGNGGYTGESLDAPLRQGYGNAALARGFLTVQTNTGHDAAHEALGSFANDYAKLVDYAFRAVHRSVVTAKMLASAYYARPAAFSYWDGCSTGGRQGLMEAERFPNDFDGILAGAPVLNFTDTMIDYIWNWQALNGVGMTVDKAKTVARAVYERCDAKDGLIADPRACDFSPARDVAACPAGQDRGDCLTAAQAEAVRKIYQGIRLPDGSPYFFGWAPGGEVVGAASDGSGAQVSGWQGWFIGMDGQTSRQTQYGLSFMRYLAFDREIADFDPAKFDFARDPARMGNIRALLDATNPDLSAFRAHGGKLIQYHGWADTALTPFMSVDFYQHALAANGPDTPNFYRLFMVPGMAHCRGGIATDSFDGISALVNWVENGRAPDRLDAARLHDGKVDRTRPLCPYPQKAVYSGHGNSDDAANFHCAE
jgi:feruloyl esterase